MDDDWFNVFVAGKPAPQGSKHPRAIYKGKGAQREFTGKVAVEESSKQVGPWRESVRSACLDDTGRPLRRFNEGIAVVAQLLFVMPRVTSMPKTRAIHHIKKPDIDKLTRAIFDALTSAGVWHDDAQVVSTSQMKRYAGIGEPPGCFITVFPAGAPIDIRFLDAVPATEQTELDL